MFLWFAGLSFAAVWSVFRSPALDHRMVMLGAVLPLCEAFAGRPLALHTLAEDREPRGEQWARIADSLSMMKQYTDGHGASLFLSIYPWGHQVRDSEWVPGRWAFMSPGQHAADTSRQTVQRLASERNIPVIDLFPAFRGYQGDRPLYFQHDNHWTTVGHEVAAAAFTDFLSSRYLDHWCGSPAAAAK